MPFAEASEHPGSAFVTVGPAVEMGGRRLERGFAPPFSSSRAWWSFFAWTLLPRRKVTPRAAAVRSELDPSRRRDEREWHMGLLLLYARTLLFERLAA